MACATRRAHAATTESADSDAAEDDESAYSLRVQTSVYATVSQVWRVLTDHEKWPQTVPSVVRARTALLALAAAWQCRA